MPSILSQNNVLFSRSFPGNYFFLVLKEIVDSDIGNWETNLGPVGVDFFKCHFSMLWTSQRKFYLHALYWAGGKYNICMAWYR